MRPYVVKKVRLDAETRTGYVYTHIMIDHTQHLIEFNIEGAPYFEAFLQFLEADRDVAIELAWATHNAHPIPLTVEHRVSRYGSEDFTLYTSKISSHQWILANKSLRKQLFNLHISSAGKMNKICQSSIRSEGLLHLLHYMLRDNTPEYYKFHDIALSGKPCKKHPSVCYEKMINTEFQWYSPVGSEEYDQRFTYVADPDEEEA